ncbi:PTS transporter subunit IIC [Lentilactobacillus parabuchneri]|uniref:Toxin regulator n=4 Tax=Lentilactobacillus TaxID=2767893 RepID=A0A0R1Z0Q2_9LACO|nr:toxin regulator [Lentilactobacillus parabuchneri DSM 5707 = NBRC 107865]KRN71658.1 toxin regulator [Lentilactobacillus parabuchneri]
MPMDTEANKPVEKLTVKDYVYLVSAGVSNAVLVMLGVGLLTQTIANFVNWPQLHQIGSIAQWLLAPAFGAAVASQLKTNTLVLFSSMIASTVGANAVYFISSGVHAATATGNQMAQVAGNGVFTTGQPISAVAAGLIAALVGKYLTGKTPLDMMLVPLAATLVGSIAGLGLASVTTPALNWLSAFIAQSMQINPIVGSMAVALAWSLFLMTPASSAALAVAVMLDPLSSGAALIGTTAQFVGFTVISWRQNNLGANIAQGFITPKVQFPNLLANPRLAIPSMTAAVVAAPIATMFFGFKVPYTLGGLGLNSFIAPLNLASTNMNMFVAYLVMGIVVPAVISIVLYRVLLGMHWVKDQQLHLEIV